MCDVSNRIVTERQIVLVIYTFSVVAFCDNNFVCQCTDANGLVTGRMMCCQ